MWQVSGPHGVRKARSWPAAVDFIAQDIKTTLVESGAEASAAEEAAWAYMRAYAEMREPFSVEVLGRQHAVEKAEKSIG